jgi:adenylate cyclase
VPEALLLILLAAAVAALAGVAVMWRRERERAERLEAELARVREKPGTARALAPPPLKAVLQTAARLREEGLGEVLRSSFEELAGLAADAEPELNRLAADDGTLTIFFSDIENSTALNEEMGDRAWVKVLGSHDRIVRRQVERRGGYVVKSQGDGFMVAFGDPTDAVWTAVEIQRSFASPPRGLRGKRVSVRIGLHTGPALEKGGDLFGRNVALAARVADQAAGGEILATDDVRDAVDDSDGLGFRERGEVELKGLPGTHALYAVEGSKG